MAILGSKQFTYEVSGDNWGKLPEGWFYKEATSVDVDSKDNVYVFNRGNHPMIVFDSEGNVLRSWGEGMFTNPHAVTIGPDDTVWCVDNVDHSIRQFTPAGKLLFTLAEPNKPSPMMSGKPFNRPTRVAIDPAMVKSWLPMAMATPGYTGSLPMVRGSSLRGVNPALTPGSLTSCTTSLLIAADGYTLPTGRTVASRFSPQTAGSRHSGLIFPELQPCMFPGATTNSFT